MESTMTTEPITSQLAVASLVTGVVAMLLSVVAMGVLLGPAALVLGMVALVQIGRSRGQRGGKNLAALGMVLGGAGLLVSVAVGLLFGVMVNRAAKLGANTEMAVEQIMENENAYAAVSMTVLGEELAARYPGKTVLVLRPAPRGVADEHTLMMLEALASGCGDGVTLVTERVQADAGASDETGMYDVVTPGMFDAAMAKHVNVDVVLVLEVWPEDYRKTKLWQHLGEAGQPALVLAEVNIYSMQDDIEAGKVALVLCENPDVFINPMAALPEGKQAMFDARYLLITAETAVGLGARHPKLFMPKAPRAAAAMDAADADADAEADAAAAVSQDKAQDDGN